jgi:hypothetical protein
MTCYSFRLWNSKGNQYDGYNNNYATANNMRPVYMDINQGYDDNIQTGYGGYEDFGGYGGFEGVNPLV